jgi:hypothetical protein
VADELTKPELGYVKQPMRVEEIDNFSVEAIRQAAEEPRTWSVALAFSTKYDPPRLPFAFGRQGEAWDRRYFDFHHDLPPGLIARVLGGAVVWGAARKGEWVAVLRFERTPGPRQASLAGASR